VGLGFFGLDPNENGSNLNPLGIRSGMSSDPINHLSDLDVAGAGWRLVVACDWMTTKVTATARMESAPLGDGDEVIWRQRRGWR